MEINARQAAEVAASTSTIPTYAAPMDRAHGTIERYAKMEKAEKRPLEAVTDTIAPPQSDRTDEPLGPSIHPVTGLPDEAPEISRPGISDEYLRRAGVRHVSADEAYDLCGLREPGLWMPYFDIHGNPQTDDGRPFGTLRLDLAKGDRKYHQHSGSRPHVGIPPGLDRLDMSTGLVLVEGYFKALALTEAGFPACGVIGFFGFKNEGEDGQDVLPPELEAALNTLKPETIYFCGDTDTAFNYQFANSAVRLAKLLGREILCPRLPVDGPGKGADDCRGVLGGKFPKWWQDRIDGSIRVRPDDHWADVALAFLEPEIGKLTRLHGEELTKAQRALGRLVNAFSNDPVRRRRLCGISKQAKLTQKDLDQLGAAAATRGSEKVIEDLRGQMRAEMGEEVFDRLVKEEGQPFTVPNTGFSVNWPFWVRAFAVEHYILFDEQAGAFFEYDDETGLWSRCRDAKVRQAASSFLAGLSLPTEIRQKMAEKRTCGTLDGFVKMLQGPTQEDDPWERNPGTRVIHLKEGMLHLSEDGCTLREFAPEYRSLSRIPFALEEGAECCRFMDEVLRPQLSEGDISLLQRWAGLALVGGNPAHAIMVIEGEGGLGKGLFVRVFEGIIGRGACFELRTSELGGRFEIGRMAGKRLLIGADVRSDFLQTEGAERLKALTGGDLLTGERKQENGELPMSGNFDALITANRLQACRIDGDITAWERRLRIVRFEGERPEKVIPDFELILLDQEGPGILRWLVEGAVAALRDVDAGKGLVASPEQKRRVDALLGASVSVETFAEACMRHHAGGTLTQAEAYGLYMRFCKANGWPPLPSKQVRKRLMEVIEQKFGISLSNSVMCDGRSSRGWYGLAVSKAAAEAGENVA